MRFEVAYGKIDEQVLLVVKSASAMTAQQAIDASGILERSPEIDLNLKKIGIFGKAAKPDVMLTEGDRVEIYRPLIADPKEAQKKRAAEGKVMRKGGGDK
ncbi:MAG: RnfH family protein [Candidatus Thiodiazotropha sp. (ex Lucinoma aequizonata)]|nr:RnfH family protein [Candidatus Thiodiazotropha sp. (ex Lucinoma aequizonata)]MCU7888664.1 RnfH family protein [Candidatus Thiodiazotropha sp. (ex Lucinoma aequizonata)]MCU7895195.1 RnfH family protein [Candidatus Thiodiazotropha sp. (ex Lucinoma aequizonata)]MCU7899451.1 RnfH family protein [Candidatus Thiodiazotropha sp. (ex Lucinoma aequizonata)]MCU7900685.1 RnfH family protein [Candidatus Thiodiazotropha sp. (ex Lucinoma aequizonata)]